MCLLLVQYHRRKCKQEDVPSTSKSLVRLLPHESGASEGDCAPELDGEKQAPYFGKERINTRSQCLEHKKHGHRASFAFLPGLTVRLLAFPPILNDHESECSESDLDTETVMMRFTTLTKEDFQTCCRKWQEEWSRQSEVRERILRVFHVKESPTVTNFF